MLGRRAGCDIKENKIRQEERGDKSKRERERGERREGKRCRFYRNIVYIHDIKAKELSKKE